MIKQLNDSWLPHGILVMDYLMVMGLRISIFVYNTKYFVLHSLKFYVLYNILQYTVHSCIIQYCIVQNHSYYLSFVDEVWIVTIDGRDLCIIVHGSLTEAMLIYGIMSSTKNHMIKLHFRWKCITMWERY